MDVVKDSFMSLEETIFICAKVRRREENIKHSHSVKRVPYASVNSKEESSWHKQSDVGFQVVSSVLSGDS